MSLLRLGSNLRRHGQRLFRDGKGFPSPDKTFSQLENTFSITDKVFARVEKRFSALERPCSVADKGPSGVEKVPSRAEQSPSDPPNPASTEKTSPFHPAKPPPFNVTGSSLRGQHFQNMPGEMLLDLAMPRDGLRHFGSRVLIPAVPPAVADEDAAEVFDLPDEIAVLHATSSSA